MIRCINFPEYKTKPPDFVKKYGMKWSIDNNIASLCYDEDKKDEILIISCFILTKKIRAEIFKDRYHVDIKNKKEVVILETEEWRYIGCNNAIFRENLNGTGREEIQEGGI